MNCEYCGVHATMTRPDEYCPKRPFGLTHYFGSVPDARVMMKEIRGNLDVIQNRLIAKGYSSLFSHTQGNDNIFILWINLETGDELMTMTVRRESLPRQSTQVYKLVPTEIE